MRKTSQTDPLEIAHVEDLDDVWVVEARRGAHFAVKALQSRGVLDQTGGEYLEGHLAAQVLLLGQIDSGHPPLTQEGEDLVLVYGTADHLVTSSPPPILLFPEAKLQTSSTLSMGPRPSGVDVVPMSIVRYDARRTIYPRGRRNGLDSP